MQSAYIMIAVMLREIFSMTIRLIKEEDLTACGLLYAEAFAAPPYNGNWTTESAADMLAGLLEKDKEHCWCIERDGRIQGVAFCTVFGTFRGTIQEFAIGPQFQGKGLGTRLMKHILEEFRSEGIKNADLIANMDAPAFGFYKKFAFRKPYRYTVMARPI